MFGKHRSLLNFETTPVGIGCSGRLSCENCAVGARLADLSQLLQLAASAAASSEFRKNGRKSRVGASAFHKIEPTRFFVKTSGRRSADCKTSVTASPLQSGQSSHERQTF
jgi:hypothetical protein